MVKGLVVRDTDRGYNRYKRMLGRKAAVDVGYWAGNYTYEDGIDMVVVAAANEFGTAAIPERSFMRSAIDLNYQLIKIMVRDNFGDVLDGSLSYDSFVKRIGIFGKTLIQMRINQSTAWAKPNSSATKALKGSAHPLVDSGDMRKHIDYKRVRI